MPHRTQNFDTFAPTSPTQAERAALRGSEWDLAEASKPGTKRRRRAMLARFNAQCKTVVSIVTPSERLMVLNAYEPKQAGPSDLDGLVVLVVEDSWQVGTGLKMLLEAWGAEVVGPVATTTDAVRLISERTPDVALVDINLRGGERSYELIDRLYDRGIRIVVISGYVDVSPARGKAAAILQKPMRENLLFESLRPATASNVGAVKENSL